MLVAERVTKTARILSKEGRYIKSRDRRLIRILILINSKPRKFLNYAMPFEKFLHEISFKKKFGKMSQLILQFMK